MATYVRLTYDLILLARLPSEPRSSNRSLAIYVRLMYDLILQARHPSQPKRFWQVIGHECYANVGPDITDKASPRAKEFW